MLTFYFVICKFLLLSGKLFVDKSYIIKEFFARVGVLIDDGLESKAQITARM